MRSLRTRLLWVILLAIGLNTAFLSSAFVLGYVRSRNHWRMLVTNESHERLAAVVTELWEEQGELTTLDSRRAFANITHFADELAAFAVYDSRKTPVFYWRNQSYPGLSPGYVLSPEFPVNTQGRRIGWVACVPSDFYFIETNRNLADIFGRILLLAIGLSTVIAVILSNAMSALVTRDAREVASILGRLSQGERDLIFPAKSCSEFREISRASVRLQATLAKEERQRRQWTQDIAHDLKTPVTALRGQLEAVKDGVLPLNENRFKLLEREFGQIDKLVKDLSLLSRVESPEMSPVISNIKGSGLIQQIEGRFSRVAESAGLGMECHVETEVIFPGDPDLLSRALNNLVQNAIQHASKPGIVRVSLEQKGNQAMFTIENPGGIPRSDLPNLFERLYRGDTGRSTPGSGLGLTIVRAVAEKHGGNVSVTNTANSSVCIRLSLPLETHD